MSLVMVEQYPHGGFKVEVDGREMQEVRDIVIRIPVDGVATLATEVNVTRDFTFIGGAQVHVVAHVFPGWRLVEQDLGGGLRWWRAEVDDGAPPVRRAIDVGGVR